MKLRHLATTSVTLVHEDIALIGIRGYHKTRSADSGALFRRGGPPRKSPKPSPALQERHPEPKSVPFDASPSSLPTHHFIRVHNSSAKSSTKEGPREEHLRPNGPPGKYKPCIRPHPRLAPRASLPANASPGWAGAGTRAEETPAMGWATRQRMWHAGCLDGWMDARRAGGRGMFGAAG